MHHVADLGFFGKVARKEGDLYPAYYVLAGVKSGAGQTQYAEKVGELSAHRIPQFVETFLKDYTSKMDRYPSYLDYLEAEGKPLIAQLCEQYKDIPVYGEDPSYYTDFGAKRRLSLDEMGSAECSAGMFDMIDVDKREIEAQSKIMNTVTDPENMTEPLYRILFSASRMLLVTRGLDTKTEEQVFQFFNKHFVETDLVDKTYDNVVSLGKLAVAGDVPKSILVSHKDRILKLGQDVIELYKGMDDSLRFKTEKEKPAETVPSRPQNDPGIVERDFRGVGCPINFVKTKLVLETMTSGQKLHILLDDGEPIQNVPNSVKLEGHRVLETKQMEGGYWSVWIEKK